MLIFILVIIPFNTAFAASEKTLDNYIPMDDNIEDHWAYTVMDDLINADIIDGFMDGQDMYVKPEDSVTRAQFVKLIVSALGLKLSGKGINFTDVKSGAWYYEPVQIASSLGIINGKSAGKFAPDDKITREEMTKVIVLAFEKTIAFPETSTKTFNDVMGRWSNQYISKAAALELVNGYGTEFRPMNNAKRAEAMAIIHRALQKEQSKLASDEEIESFLKGHIQRENELAEALDVEGLIQLYQENGTGYYLADTILYSDFADIEETNVTISIDDENIDLNVVEKSDRFATVEVTGMTLKVFVQGEVESITVENMQLDGEYKLKKDSISGNWKIYSYY